MLHCKDITENTDRLKKFDSLCLDLLNETYRESGKPAHQAREELLKEAESVTMLLKNRYGCRWAFFAKLGKEDLIALLRLAQKGEAKYRFRCWLYLGCVVCSVLVTLFKLLVK